MNKMMVALVPSCVALLLLLVLNGVAAQEGGRLGRKLFPHIIHPTAKTNDRYSDSLEGVQTLKQREIMLESCDAVRRLETTQTMTFPEFIDIFFDVIAHVQQRMQPLTWVIQNFDYLVRKRGALPNGSWTEFGVFEGRTLKETYDFFSQSKAFQGTLAGFDSFEGLPTKWRTGFEAGAFADGDQYNRIRAMFPDQVELYKGWFQDTIGEFLTRHPNVPATLIHHDGDLFVSTTITFSLLHHRIVPGTIMCFDEIMGYPGFEQHEMLALFLWMKLAKATLCPLAVKGPIQKHLLKNVQSDFPPQEQSACFQVLDLEH